MVKLKRLSDEEMIKIQQPILRAHGYGGIYEAFRAVAQAQLEADQKVIDQLQSKLEELERIVRETK